MADAPAADVEEDDDEVARLNREIADLRTKLSKANKGKKEEKDPELAALEKEDKKLKLKVSVEERKKKYKELHPHTSTPLWKIALGIMAVILVLFAVVAMNQPHPSPGLAHAQRQVAQGSWALLNWVGGIGVLIFFGMLIKSSIGKQKKSAGGGGGAKHH